jgi:hypothetical protein
VELDGTESQASGSITDYSWTLTGSPPTGVSLSDANTATPIFDASDADVPSDTDVTVELTVTDPSGNTDTDTATVTVTQTSSSGDGGDGGASLVYNDDAVTNDGPDPGSVAGGVNFSVTNRFGENVTITDIRIAPENSSISTLSDNVRPNDEPLRTEVYIAADLDDAYVDYGGGTDIPRTVDLDTDGRNDGGNATLSDGAAATFYLYEFTVYEFIEGPKSVNMSGEDVEITITYQPASGGTKTKTFTITPTSGGGGGGVTYLEADDGSANTAPTAIDLEESGGYDGYYEAARIGIVNTESEQIDRVNSITVELPDASDNIKRIDAPSGDRDSYGAEVYFAGNNNNGYIDLSSGSISLGDEASFESGSGSRQVGDIDSNSGIVVKLSQFRKSGGGPSGSDADMSGKDVRLTINFEAGGSTYTETVSVTLDNQAQA